MKRRSHIGLLVTLVLVAISLVGCDRASTSGNAETQWIDPSKLEAGPIQRASLTDAEMARVHRLQKTFSEVDSSSIEKWVDDFKRDLNLERELSIWEGMATAYETYTVSNNLTLDAKKEVFQVVLLRSGAPADEVLKHLELKSLAEKDARDIMALFPDKPQPIRVISQ